MACWQADVLFLASAPSLGFAVFDVCPAESPCAIDTGLRVSQGALENERYRVAIDPASGCFWGGSDRRKDGCAAGY